MTTDDSIGLGCTLASANHGQSQTVKVQLKPAGPAGTWAEEASETDEQLFVSKSAPGVRIAFDSDRFRASEVQRRLAKILR